MTETITEKDKIEADRRALSSRVADLLFEAHVPMDVLEVIVRMVSDAVKDPVVVPRVGWVK